MIQDVPEPKRDHLPASLALVISYAMRAGRLVEARLQHLPAGTPRVAIWVSRQEGHAQRAVPTAAHRTQAATSKGPLKARNLHSDQGSVEPQTAETGRKPTVRSWPRCRRMRPLSSSTSASPFSTHCGHWQKPGQHGQRRRAREETSAA